MQTISPMLDRSRDMDEKTWWNAWNTAHRTKDNSDPVSSELFARTAAVVNEITCKQSCRVLEIGCGAGSLSRLLTYFSYHGLDISSAAIDIARRKAEPPPRRPGASPPTYEVTDFHEWSPPQDSFDLAVCVDAVAYFRDQSFAMNKIAQTLRPSGRLVLTTINPFVYRRIRRTATNPLAEGPVSHWLTCGELNALMEAAGFSVERSWTIMPRGNCGILRLINARRVNEAFGPQSAAALRRLKEQVGLGQYRLVVARKKDVV
jgi:2-polyprenyl-3-methyl-5-hydroxy-6-metoxy-1,4-benzoquinol methylase